MDRQAALLPGVKCELLKTDSQKLYSVLGQTKPRAWRKKEQLS